MKPLLNNDFIQNSCYTQITHVEQQSPWELYTSQNSNPPPTRTCSKLQNIMTKIGIKYNLICQNRLGQKMVSTPGPIIKPSPAFLKEIKTDPALVNELLATIAKRNKAITPKKQTTPIHIWFGTVEPDTYSEYSISSTPRQSPTPQPALACARACTPPTPPSPSMARKNPSAPRLGGESIPQGIKEIIFSRIQAATIAAAEKCTAEEPASPVLEQPDPDGYHIQIRRPRPCVDTSKKSSSRSSSVPSPHKWQRTSPIEGWTPIPQNTRPAKASAESTDTVMPTARHEMPQEYQGMRTTDPPDTDIWEGPLPVPRAITPQDIERPLTDITPEMFWESPETNPGTPQDNSDKAFEAYEPDPGHQVEMTLEEPEYNN